jgi:DNA-binding transcriptional LysR family regulator
MEWNDVRVFLAVARSAGLSGAGRVLNASPQTVGRRIVALETALGSSLFLRGPTGYQLTDDGRALLLDAEHIEQSMADFLANASRRATALAGTVRLAAAENFVTFLLLPAFAPFLELHPELNIDFITGIPAVSMPRGEADLALRLVRPEGGELTVRRVGTMVNALYASPAYLAAHPDVRENPLASARIVGWDTSNAHLPAARWLTSHAGRQPSFTFTTLAAQRVAVASGLGVALLPCFLTDGLERLPFDDVLSEPIWLVAHATSIASDRIRAVYQEVMRIMTEAHDKLSG